MELLEKAASPHVPEMLGAELELTLKVILTAIPIPEPSCSPSSLLNLKDASSRVRSPRTEEPGNLHCFM